MTTEVVLGWVCIVVALVLICTLTILDRMLPVVWRAERIWNAWQAVSRDKPWPNDVEGISGTVYDMGTGRQVAP